MRCLGAKHCDEQRVTALSSACLTWLLDEEAFPNGRDLREQLLELRLTERDGRAKLYDCTELRRTGDTRALTMTTRTDKSLCFFLHVQLDLRIVQPLPFACSI